MRTQAELFLRTNFWKKLEVSQDSPFSDMKVDEKGA